MLCSARLIREKYPENIPIVLLTAYDWGDIEQEAMEASMDAHIAKPVQIDTLKSTIRQVLDSRLEQPEEAGKI